MKNDQLDSAEEKKSGVLSLKECAVYVARVLVSEGVWAAKRAQSGLVSVQARVRLCLASEGG